MARAKREWIVTRHDPIQKLDDNLWVVEGDVPGAPIKRRMSIVKRADGSLVFFHAIPLEEKALEEVKAWGTPSYLVLGHHHHAMDAGAFREKLALKAYGPRACEAKLRERVELAGTLESFPSDSTIRVESAPGTKSGETVAIVSSGGGERVSILFTDVIQNNPKESTLWFFRALGFAGGPKVVWMFRTFFLKDAAALKAGLENWAALPGLHRLVPCHGTIVERDAASALKAAAAAL